MIDIRILRESPEKIRENLEKRNITNFPLDELFDLEKKRREFIAKNQKLKEERNKISVEISTAKIRKECNFIYHADETDLGRDY